jgi:hypothetical protein
VSQLKEFYDSLVQTTMQSYSPRFLEVMDEDIRTVLEDKAPFKEMQELFIDSYAANLQADELDAAIRAHFNPEQTKSIFADTPDRPGLSVLAKCTLREGRPGFSRRRLADGLKLSANLL